MAEWRRSPGAQIFIAILSGMLIVLAIVAWRAIGLVWAVALLVAAFALLFVTDDYDDDHRPGKRAWGEHGERWSMSDSEFDALIHEVESSAATIHLDGAATGDAEEGAFAAIVRDAIEELPAFVRNELARNVAIIIADDGASADRHGLPPGGELFGLYVGWTASAPNEGAKIILFRDTLTRRFEDRDELRAEVAITLRHEIAHHLGADERRVEELGL